MNVIVGSGSSLGAGAVALTLILLAGAGAWAVMGSRRWHPSFPTRVVGIQDVVDGCTWACDVAAPAVVGATDDDLLRAHWPLLRAHLSEVESSAASLAESSDAIQLQVVLDRTEAALMALRVVLDNIVRLHLDPPDCGGRLLEAAAEIAQYRCEELEHVTDDLRRLEPMA